MIGFSLLKEFAFNFLSYCHQDEVMSKALGKMLVQEYTDILKSLIESDRHYRQMVIDKANVSEAKFIEYLNYKQRRMNF